MPRWVSIGGIAKAPKHISRHLDELAEKQGAEFANSIISLFNGKGNKKSDEELKEWCGVNRGGNWGSNGW